MDQPAQPKRPYQQPSVTSLRVFLPMLAATTGSTKHPHVKRLPFSP